LKGFLFVIVALQVARKIASCDMAFKNVGNQLIGEQLPLFVLVDEVT